MKWLVPLTLIGAVVGGIYPGAFLAFVWAAPSGSERVVFITNLILSIFGASVGMLASNALRQQTFRPRHAILPIAFGLVCGVVGYLVDQPS
ncbi:MAG: hypothetical protein ACRELF_10240 [Gemmataceae bacterium]